MLNCVLRGVAAGSVGTVTLNVVTYADMFLRGRPASEVPAQLAGHLAGEAGAKLDFGGDAEEQVYHRQEALGALLGYATGLGIGAIYGGLRPHLGNMSLVTASLGLGLGAMAVSDIPLAVTRVSDPRTWGAAGWVADLVPHLAYGLMTAVTYQAFTPD